MSAQPRAVYELVRRPGRRGGGSLNSCCVGRALATPVAGPALLHAAALRYLVSRPLPALKGGAAPQRPYSGWSCWPGKVAPRSCGCAGGSARKAGRCVLAAASSLPLRWEWGCWWPW
eukprot:COSAG01_NODE_152_length_23937_cov_122.193976_13_plen_117_part_00